MVKLGGEGGGGLGCNNKIFPKNVQLTKTCFFSNRGKATSRCFILVNPENITNLENLVILNALSRIYDTIHKNKTNQSTRQVQRYVSNIMSALCHQ